MKESTLPTWQDVWSWLDKEEQQDALVAFTSWLRALPAEQRGSYYEPFIRALSKRMRFRVQSVKKMAAQQQMQAIHRHIYTLFDIEDWQRLFIEHYMHNKCELMCRFLDLCGIAHDEKGSTDEDIVKPDNLDKITDKIVTEFSIPEVARYYSVLVLLDPDVWLFIKPLLSDLIDQLEQPEVTSQPQVNPEPLQEESLALDMSEDFTQLDRILIDQVIATVAEEDRALEPDELVDLLEGVHALDTGRKRTYFHLGFMDALLPGREAHFGRPEINDERRGWYLAGLLTGAVRRRDAVCLRKLLKDQSTHYRRAIQRPSGFGATMMRSIYPYLLDEGLYADAIALLRGQAEAAGLHIVEMTLQKASAMIRHDDAVGANSLLSTLYDTLGRTLLNNEQKNNLQAVINRRRGQAMQAQGHLDAAKELFEGLIKDDGSNTPGLLADMGLVVAGFRHLSEVQIHNADERRQVTHDSLELGKHYFEQATEKYCSDAPNAQYALAVLTYLECMNPHGGKACPDELRSKALAHVTSAMIGMTNSMSSGIYEELGILGRARFIQAVLLMNSCETAQARTAMNAWREISEQAGMLPAWDVQQMIEAAELINHEYAIEIGESIWRHRQADALGIIRNTSLLAESDYLRSELLSLVRLGSKSTEETWTLWTLLIPALLSKNKIELAEEGLDRLEDLAVNSRYAEQMLEWLEQPSHYEPAWSEEDVLRTRFRLLRRMGRDADAFEMLRQLFFLFRDQRLDEAVQVYALFKDYGANQALYADLALPNTNQDVSEDEPQIVDQLRSGEQVRVLFIGGNEIQARYDDTIIHSIRKEWPGVEVTFEHTGWSSNWGRDVARLKKLSSESDAVVLMTMMRTKLGRTMRAALNDPPRPWIPCTGTGKQALKNSIRKAVLVGLQQSDNSR